MYVTSDGDVYIPSKGWGLYKGHSFLIKGNCLFWGSGFECPKCAQTQILVKGEAIANCSLCQNEGNCSICRCDSAFCKDCLQARPAVLRFGNVCVCLCVCVCFDFNPFVSQAQKVQDIYEEHRAQERWGQVEATSARLSKVKKRMRDLGKTPQVCWVDPIDPTQLLGWIADLPATRQGASPDGWVADHLLWSASPALMHILDMHQGLCVCTPITNPDVVKIVYPTQIR